MGGCVPSARVSLEDGARKTGEKEWILHGNMWKLMLDLSVIVPTHNRLDLLPALLASLTLQDYPPDRWELIIVDDGSNDGTREYLASGSGQRPANMRTLSQAQSGVAVTRNSGVRMAGARAVLFLDDDMIASPSLVRHHAEVHLRDPDAVVIGHVSVPDGKREPWVAWEDAQLERHFSALKKGLRIPGPRDFYTGNCSVSSRLLERVHGFNTSLPRAEDVELGYRLAAEGARFHYSPESDSLHLGRHPFANWLRNAKLYGQCDVLLGWELGHSLLQSELFRWYNLRNGLNRALVRICAAAPPLQTTAIGGLDLIGRAANKLGAKRASLACYSAIYNLAYWLSVAENVGKARFWANVKSQAFAGNARNARNTGNAGNAGTEYVEINEARPPTAIVES